MARYWFGDSDDWSLSVNTDGSLRRTPSTRKYYTAEVGGVQHVDLLINGTTSADSVPSSGLPVRFQGPDGVLSMWESANDGPRVLVQSTDGPQLAVDAAEAILSVESTVTEARDEAVAAAATATAPTAGVVNAVLADTGSAARATLNAAVDAGVAAGAIAPQGVNITVTVGTGGDYATINAALTALSRKRLLHKASATVHLLTGFVMAEQVMVSRSNLGWIQITAADRPVTISRAALTVVSRGSLKPAFFAEEGGTLPVIACLFNMDTSGTAGTQTGIHLVSRSSISLAQGTALARNGITNAAYRGVNCQEGSQISGVFADFSGAGLIGVRVANGSLAGMTYLKATGCGEAGASIGGAAVNFDEGDFSNSAIGMNVAQGATASFSRGVATGCTTLGIRATGSASIAAAGANVSGSGWGVHATEKGRIDFTGGNASGCPVYGLLAQRGGSISAFDADAFGCGTNGVLAGSGSDIYFELGDASNCPTGIQAQNGSTVNAASATATGCTTYGAYATSGARMDLANAILTGAGTNGIRAINGSFVNANGANTRKGVSDSGADTIVLTGSTMNAHAITGGILPAKNTITASGIIFQA